MYSQKEHCLKIKLAKRYFSICIKPEWLKALSYWVYKIILVLTWLDLKRIIIDFSAEKI